MRTVNGNQEVEDYGEDEFCSKGEGPSSNTTVHSNNNSSAGRDAKENDKASVIRSKHSVTEQRRRSKINERFQILRELIPNSEQKRDTASFLLEVIDYVQYLQEKVQKYEGSYLTWSQQPTKLTPWRNNHWRVQSLSNPPVAINNGSSPVIPFPGKFEENTVTSTPEIIAEMQKSNESVKGRATICKPKLDEKGLPSGQPIHPLVHSEQANNECPATSDGLGQSNDLAIEGGTISISSVYSHELLSSLTQALQNAGIDLSHARLSVQIDVGKRGNQGLTHAEPFSKSSLPNVEEVPQHSQKRIKAL